MNRKLFASLLVSTLGILIAIFVNILTGKQTFLKFFTGFGAGALIAVVLLLFVLSLLATYLQHHFENRTDTRGVDTDFDASVRSLIASLRDRYEGRYEQKLDGRFEISLEVTRFLDHSEPIVINERFGSNPIEGEATLLISNLFEQTGRLLILGEAGSGKTVLLLKLASALLDRMKKDSDGEGPAKDGQPTTSLPITHHFPIILNLASWTTEYKKFEEWLIAALLSGNGLSKDFATKLINKNRVIAFLDGLDELGQNEDKAIAAKKRADCLASLNEYLRHGRKAVVCSRCDEFVQLSELTGQQAPVADRVAILKPSKAQILLALQHAAIDRETTHHASATNLAALLVRDDHQHLLDTMRTPFYFNTALELFDQQIPQEQTLPEDTNQLRRYVIGQFFQNKLRDTPNLKNFNPNKARRSLQWLAHRMKQRQLVTFELADLQPTDLKWRSPFHILYGVLTYLLLSFPIALLFVLMPLWEPSFGTSIDDLEIKVSSRFFAVVILEVFLLAMALLIGALGFLPFSLLFAFRTKTISTEDASKFSLRPLLKLTTWKDILTTMVLYCSLLVLVVGLMSALQKDRAEAVRFLLTGFLVLGAFVFIERVSNYCRVVKKFVSLKHDYQRLRTGLLHNLIRWQVVLLCVMFLGNCIEVAKGTYPKGILWRLFEFRASVLLLPFTLVLSVINAAILKHFVLRTCLVLRGRIPIRYASFLNYAVELRILEKDGGHWRFRHQNLQNYFSGSDEPIAESRKQE